MASFDARRLGSGLALGLVVAGIALVVAGTALVGAATASAQDQPDAVATVDVDLVDGGAWVTWSDGRVEARALGGAAAPVQPPALASPLALGEDEQVVALVPAGAGYWLFTSRGQVAAAGGAGWFGDLSTAELNGAIVAAVPTASGGGYYMLGTDGGVFAFGDAVFYGSVQGIVDEHIGPGALSEDHLTAPLVTLATTTAGYWLVAADGAVFPFGDAPYHGSFQDVLNTDNRLEGIERAWTITPPRRSGAPLARRALVAPIVDLVPAADGAGYLMVAADGGIFNFGNSRFHGSLAGRTDSAAMGADVTASRGGYVIVTEDGRVRLFGLLGDDGPDDGSGTASDERADSGPATPATPATPSTQATLRATFADASLRRQRIVKELTAKLKSGEYGVDRTGVLRGPAGFAVDLSDCPQGWNDERGVTFREVRIGHTTPLTGSLGAYGNFTKGWQNYLDWVNEHDPLVINGRARRLVLVVRDDAYAAAQTAAATELLIERERVFSVLTLGTPNTMAVYDTLNDQCIPHPFAISAHPAWGDPANHPWTTGLAMSFATEPVLWGSWIEDRLRDQLPVKVAGLVMDNEFGQTYASRFQAWADANPGVVSEFVAVRHHPAATAVSGEMAAVAAAVPDVFISMTVGNPCLLAMRESASLGLFGRLAPVGNARAAITPSVCAGVEAYMAPAGPSAAGWWTAGGGTKQTTPGSYAGDAFIDWMNANLTAAGLDAQNPLFGAGYFHAYPYVEALRTAAALPGGLTRTNFILAERSSQLHHPLLVDGIGFSLNGAADAYPVEGSEFSRFDATGQRWVAAGGVVNVNGRTASCHWDAATGRCR